MAMWPGRALRWANAHSAGDEQRNRRELSGRIQCMRIQSACLSHLVDASGLPGDCALEQCNRIETIDVRSMVTTERRVQHRAHVQSQLRRIDWKYRAVEQRRIGTAFLIAHGDQV